MSALHGIGASVGGGQSLAVAKYQLADVRVLVVTVGNECMDTNPVFIDLKPQTILFVVLDQLTEVRIGNGVDGQALFKFGIVGIDFGSAVVFVEILFADFSFLLGDLFIYPSFLWFIFPALELGNRDWHLTVKPRTIRWSFTAFLSAKNPNLQTQDISHRLRRFLMCRGCHMGIGVQREACREMPQHAGSRLDIHTVLQGDGSEGMAKVVESDFGDTRALQDSLKHIIRAVR